MIIVSVLGYNTTKGFGNKIFRLIGDLILAKEYYKVKDEDFWIYFDSEDKVHSVINDNTKKKYEYLCKNYGLDVFFDIRLKIINKDQMEKLLENDSPDYLILKSNDLINEKPYITIETKKLAGVSNGFPILPNEIEEVSKFKSYETKFNGTFAFMYDKIPNKYWLKYRNYFKLFKIQPEINIDYPVNRETIGVHIRRGDFKHYQLKKLNRNTHSDDKFINEINNLLPKFKNIFLSSDDQEIQNKFKKIYGLKLLYIETDSNVRDEKIAMQCINLLSKCGHLILSHLSSFSELSWWFSEEKLPITYIK